MRILILLLLIVLALSLIAPKSPYANGKKEMIMFHMNGCVHCERLMPTWDNFSKNNTTKIATKKLERRAAMHLLKKYNVASFPTILMLDGGRKVEKYAGPRTLSGLQGFAKRHS